MKIIRSILIITFILCSLFVKLPSVQAFPPLPSSFYGIVKVNDANVSEGTIVSVWIDGVQYASTTIEMYQGDSVFSLDCPGDDASTVNVIEGGVQGDTIVFKIGDLVADQEGAWATGTNVRLDLSATFIEPGLDPSSYFIFLPLILK